MHADGLGKRVAALALLDAIPASTSRTIRVDEAYDMYDFIAAYRRRRVTPRVATNNSGTRPSAIDARTTRHKGSRLSQIRRRRIEEYFGWRKMLGRIRKTVSRGTRRADQYFKLTMAASILVRKAQILSAMPQKGAK
jgi:thioesterase domain-containing protein